MLASGTGQLDQSAIKMTKAASAGLRDWAKLS